MSLLAELKHRNVLRAGALYAAAVWALAQGIAQLTSVVNAPAWVARWFLVAAVTTDDDCVVAERRGSSRQTAKRAGRRAFLFAGG